MDQVLDFSMKKGSQIKCDADCSSPLSSGSSSLCGGSTEAPVHSSMMIDSKELISRALQLGIDTSQLRASSKPSSTCSPPNMQLQSLLAPRLPSTSLFPSAFDPQAMISQLPALAHTLSPNAALAAAAAFSPLVSSSLFPGSPTMMTEPGFFGNPGTTSLALSGLHRRRRAPSQSVSSGTGSAADSSAKKSKPVPDEKKDDSYWERRRKNNEAAKRSRDVRRAKEEDVALRAAFLEQENLKLKAQVAILKNETAKLHYMIFSHVRPDVTK